MLGGVGLKLSVEEQPRNSIERFRRGAISIIVFQDEDLLWWLLSVHTVNISAQSRERLPFP